MYVLELPHKAGRRRCPGILGAGVGGVSGVPVAAVSRRTLPTTKIREAIRLMNRERRLRRELAALMKSDRPPLLGRQLLDCKSSIWAMPEALQQYQRVLDACPSPAATARRQRHQRVRVLMTGVPMVSGAERVLDIVEHSGGLVVAQENCTGLKPLLEDVDEMAADPLRALAEKYFRLPCSVMTPNDRRLDVLAPTGGRLSARVRRRVGLAGLPDLRRGIAPHQAFRRGGIGLALLAHRDRLLAFRFRPHRHARGSPVGNGVCPQKRGQVQFAGTAQRVLRTNWTCPLFCSANVAGTRRVPSPDEPSPPRPLQTAHEVRLLRWSAGAAGMDRGPRLAAATIAAAPGLRSVVVSGLARRLPLRGGTDRRDTRRTNWNCPLLRRFGVDHRLRSDALRRRAAGKPRPMARSFSSTCRPRGKPPRQGNSTATNSAASAGSSCNWAGSRRTDADLAEVMRDYDRARRE